LKEKNHMLGAQKFLEAVKAGDLPRLIQMLMIDPGLANARAESGASALMLSIYHGKAEVSELLIDRGARLDVHEAVAAGKLERVAELVAKNPAEINSFSADGFAPLALAAFFGHRQIVEWLLSHGAEINAVSKNATGYTALTGSVARGDPEIVRMLLAHGADARHRYGSGYSALHEAAASGKLEIAKLLLEHGADPSARNEEGQTPLAMAEAKEQAETTSLLRERGGTK
jgi:uncharacterized protein